MPLGIVEPAAGLAMLVGCHGLACMQTGCPSTMMRLEVQTVVRSARGQLQQPVGQSATVAVPAATVGRLPKAVDRHKQLARVTSPLGKVTGTGIGPGRL